MDCIYYVGPTTLYRLKNQKGHIRIIEYQEFRDEYNASRKALHSVEKNWKICRNIQINIVLGNNRQANI